MFMPHLHLCKQSVQSCVFWVWCIMCKDVCRAGIGTKAGHNQYFWDYSEPEQLYGICIHVCRYVFTYEYASYICTSGYEEEQGLLHSWGDWGIQVCVLPAWGHHCSSQLLPLHFQAEQDENGCKEDWGAHSHYLGEFQRNLGIVVWP